MNLLFSYILIHSASISFLCSPYVVKAFTTLELTTLVSRARQNNRYGQATNLYYSNVGGNKYDGEDENILSDKIVGHANEDIGTEILELSASDKRRLLSIRSRSKVMPLMIIDTLLPKQSITFGSSDPKFSKLLDYLLGEKTSCGEENNNSDQKNNKIGIIGFNPFTESPLTFGVSDKFIRNYYSLFSVSNSVSKKCITNYKFPFHSMICEITGHSRGKCSECIGKEKS